jgi:hypothetical protein
MRPNHPEECLMGLVGPLFGDQQGHVAAPDVHRPVQDALGPVAGDRHADLLADVAVGVVERRCLGDDRLIEHEQDGVSLAVQAAFEPPFDCLQVEGRRASW